MALCYHFASVSPHRDEYLDDDEPGRFSPRSLLASGWLRALFVLGALAVILAVSVPYVLRWLDGTPPVERPGAKVIPPPARAPTAIPAMSSKAESPAAPAPAPGKTESIQPVPPVERPPAAAAQSRPRQDSAPSAPTSKGPTVEPRKPAAKAGSRDASAPAPAGTGRYWVQVGVFQDATNAERLANTLRAQKVPVQVVKVSRGSSAVGSRHEVVVNGASVEAVTAALRGSGTAQQAGAVVAVRPALDLREAVALSRRLAAEGLSVKIRRVGDVAPRTEHLVRVGDYPSRAAADAGRKDMHARGLPAFVTQGGPR